MNSLDRRSHRASTSAVLGFAWDAGVFRGDHVMAALGLTRSTALVALNRLIELGLVSELPAGASAENSGPGRPARSFRLRAEAGVVVGVDAGERSFVATASDLAGGVLARTAIEPAARGGEHGARVLAPEERRSLAFRAVDAVLAAAGRSRADVIGVGVGIPAPVDAAGDSPTHPSGVWRGLNAGLRAAFATEFPTVRVETDAALAAVAESRLGEARGHDNFVAVLARRRLRPGVFLDGRPVRGARGAVGEIDGCCDAAEDVAGRLGQVCRMAASCYDPDLIVVCGSAAAGLGDAVAAAAERLRAETDLPAPRIVASQLGGDVVALGAACVARDQARDVALDLFSERLSAVRTEC